MDDPLIINAENNEPKDDEYYLERAIDKSAFERICRKVEDFLFDISSYILLIVVAYVCADVFMRYVFNNPFRTTIAVSELLEVLIVSLGGCYLLREEGFVTIDLLISKVQQSTRFLMIAITSLISAIFLAIICYGSTMKTVEFIMSNATFLDSRQFPAWIYMAPLAFFYLFLCIGFIRRGMRYLRARKLVLVDRKGEVSNQREGG